MNVVFGVDCSHQVYSPRDPSPVLDVPIKSPSSSIPSLSTNRPDELTNGPSPSIAMASRGGPHVAGTDGMDFLHRERVATHYQVSAQNKARLKYCIYCHYVLFLVMLVKMVPDILDRFDIFILEIEELFVPPPLVWEYVWVLSALFTFSGLSAVKKNKLKSLRIYQVGTIVFGILPVLFGLFWFAKDVKKYVETRSYEGIQVWQDYPWSMLVYAFLVPALQLHALSLFFSHKLASAWKLRSAKKAQ